MTKYDILKLLILKRRDVMLKSKDYNASNDLKAINLCTDLLQFIDDRVNLNISIPLNFGEIFELAYNHAHHHYITSKAPKGSKDNNNAYNSELKALINAHSTIDTTLQQLDNNKGYLIILSDGVIYQLDSDVIKSHLLELKCYNNKYRLSNTFIRRYGKINGWQFQYK